MVVGHPLKVTILHGWTYARWERVYITMNRKEGDYELYPKLWAKFPDTGKAFERRIKEKVYFTKRWQCDHPLDVIQHEGGSAPEVSIEDFQAQLRGEAKAAEAAIAESAAMAGHSHSGLGLGGEGVAREAKRGQSVWAAIVCCLLCCAVG